MHRLTTAHALATGLALAIAPALPATAAGPMAKLDKTHAIVSVICWRGAYQEGGPLYRIDRATPRPWNGCNCRSRAGCWTT